MRMIRDFKRNLHYYLHFHIYLVWQIWKHVIDIEMACIHCINGTDVMIWEAKIKVKYDLQCVLISLCLSKMKTSFKTQCSNEQRHFFVAFLAIECVGSNLLLYIMRSPLFSQILFCKSIMALTDEPKKGTQRKRITLNYTLEPFGYWIQLFSSTLQKVEK